MTAETRISQRYESKTINQRIGLARKRPVPRMLFGEFWLEGELAVLFGDTGMGKSLLAVQIAESIARGRAIYPLDMDAKPQRALYFDFELSEKQLEMRYSKEQKPQHDSLKCHYRFSDRFYRIRINPNDPLPNGFRTFDEYLIAIIKERVSETGAKVVIIDNVTHLKRSYSSASDTIRLMNALNHLKQALGLSILLLAHSRKNAWSRTLTAGDSQSSRVLASLADSVFAIGKPEGAPAGRYLKHLKTRSTEMVYDASNVPLFCIRKLEDNFLGFGFLWFDPERTLRYDAKHPREREISDEIVTMSDKGMSIRQIAAALDMPKSTVHRLLRTWEPPRDLPPPRRIPLPQNSNEMDDEVDDWEPEGEEYTDEQDASETEVSSDDDVGTYTDENISNQYEEKHNPEQYQPLADIGLSRKIDGYGREILVETEDTNGRPAVWYQFDPKGVKHRFERRSFVISRARVPPDLEETSVSFFDHCQSTPETETKSGMS
jgi:hypothetical protein